MRVWYISAHGSEMSRGSGQENPSGLANVSMSTRTHRNAMQVPTLSRSRKLCSALQDAPLVGPCCALPPCLADIVKAHEGVTAQETIAIKFEDNQAKGAPNQLKTEYDGRAC